MTDICVNCVIIDSVNGLSPMVPWHQAITLTNADWISMQDFSVKKMHLKMLHATGGHFVEALMC